MQSCVDTLDFGLVACPIPPAPVKGFPRAAVVGREAQQVVGAKGADMHDHVLVPARGTAAGLSTAGLSAAAKSERWSRRQVFTVLLGAGAVATAAAVAAPAIVSTVRDESGRTTITRGRGAPTSFGSVAVVSASLAPRTPRAAQASHGGHAAATADDATVAAHNPWADALRVDIEVHNGLDRPILLSPGQFRLQVGPDGPSVAPYDFELAVREVAAHTTVSGWISYLAPPGGAATLSLSYDDVARPEPTTLVFEVAPLATNGGTQ